MGKEEFENTKTEPRKSNSTRNLIILLVIVAVLGAIVYFVVNGNGIDGNGIGGSGSKTYTGTANGKQCSITIDFSTGKWSYSGYKISYYGDYTVLSSTQIELQGKAINEVGKVNGMTKYNLLGNTDVNFDVYVAEDKSYVYITYYFASYGIKCS